MATRTSATTTRPEPTSSPPPPTPEPSSHPTSKDPPKTTTDLKPTEVTTTTTTTDPKPTEVTTTATITTTSAAPETTPDKPTTTTTTTTAIATTMSTVEPSETNSSQEPSLTTTDTPVTTNITTEPPVTKTTTNPPESTTTDPPVTNTTSDPPTTTSATTDPPVTKTTTDPPVTTDSTTTTTKDPPISTTTTTKDPIITTATTDPPVKTTKASTPYTTRYITTFSIVTVTTVVPEPTVISGTGTTIYVTRSTTSPKPTMIQDPSQPPPGTETDSPGKGLQTWQITLIVVATLILMVAVGAVVLVGKIKRQKRERDTMLSSGDGLESAFGSEMGESGGGRSNRTLLVGGKQKHYHSGDTSGDLTSVAAGPAIRIGGGGWRERLSAWRPWDGHGSYHHQQQHPGGLDYNQGQGQGGGGGLWLMDEPDPHYDISTAAAGVAAAMRPVSYDTSGGLNGPGDTIVGEGEDPSFYANYPYNNTQPQDRYYDREEGAFTASAMATAPRGAAGTLHPMDDITLTPIGVQRGPSSVTTAATAMTSRSQQRQLQEQPSCGSVIGQTSPSLVQLERLSAEEGSDYIDSHGFHRQSQDWTLSSVTSTGAGIGTGGATAAIEDRTLRVDLDQLESNAKFELVRKAPQAILGTSSPRQQDSEGGKSPPLPSAPPPPPSSSTAESDTEAVEMLADVHSKDNNVVSESDPTVTTLLSIESTPVSKPISLVSEQQPPPQE